MIIGAASSSAVRASSSAAWSMPSSSVCSAACPARRRPSRRSGRPGRPRPGRSPPHADHQREQAEDDQAGGQAGLEPVTLERADEGLEDHGQNGGERQREHDLAHRRQGGHHDDRRHDEPDEAPRPDPQPRDPADEPGDRLGASWAWSLGAVPPSPSTWFDRDIDIASREPGTRHRRRREPPASSGPSTRGPSPRWHEIPVRPVDRRRTDHADQVMRGRRRRRRGSRRPVEGGSRRDRDDHAPLDGAEPSATAPRGRRHDDRRGAHLGVPHWDLLRGPVHGSHHRGGPGEAGDRDRRVRWACSPGSCAGS